MGEKKAYGKVSNPERRLLREDESSVQLARHLERINDKISLGGGKLDGACRDSIRLS
jgi:hypothetical protein